MSLRESLSEEKLMLLTQEQTENIEIPLIAKNIAKGLALTKESL